jgi:uncharacterized protein (TIGR00369 family)
MPNFTPRDPNYAARVHASFERQQVMILLGARLTRLAPGQCEITLPHKPELTQQHGYLHGGIIGTIGDSAGGYAAYTLMPHDASVLTIEYKMNIMAPGDGELFVARGEVIRAGRTLVVARADVFAVKAGKETHCASLLQTLMTMHGKVDY